MVSGCDYALKLLREHTPGGTTMIIINRIIPNVGSALWTHGPQDPNQSKSSRSRKALLKESL